MSFGPGAGVLVAIVLGATPAALLGLDLAWIVVAIGATILFLAPWLARAQVLAIESVELPPACQVHAGKTVEVGARLRLSRPARMLLMALVRPDDPRASRDRAPRILVAAGGSTSSLPDAGVSLQLPLRVPTRGRSDTLLLLVRSSYPFGLVSASRSMALPLQLTALPRLSQEREVGLQRMMPQLAGAFDEGAQRPAIYGGGLPAGLRDARTGDSRRDLHMRSSLRRRRWTAKERSELGHGLAQVTLHVPPTDGHPSRRSIAAFEAATSTAAAIIQGLHRLGLDVDLGTRAPISGVEGHPRPRRQSLLRSKSTLAHLHSLTDVSFSPVSPARSAPRAAGKALTLGNPRGVAIEVEVIPIVSSSEHGDGRVGAQLRGVGTDPGPVRITLCVDASGRVSQRGASE